MNSYEFEGWDVSSSTNMFDFGANSDHDLHSGITNGIFANVVNLFYTISCIGGSFALQVLLLIIVIITIIILWRRLPPPPPPPPPSPPPDYQTTPGVKQG